MGGGSGFGAFGGTAGSNQRERLLSVAKNPKLISAIDQIYRPGAGVGDGGLADAIRHEKETGERVGGRSHIRKGKERLRNLRNILANEDLSARDTNIVKQLIADLQDALK